MQDFYSLRVSLGGLLILLPKEYRENKPTVYFLWGSEALQGYIRMIKMKQKKKDNDTCTFMGLLYIFNWSYC